MGNAILFVDDEVVILNALEAVFTREGFETFTATNGDDALEILEREKVDVVITDERMPGITGIELLSLVREKYPEKIRIVLTAYAELNTILSAINKVEAHRLIIKPYRNDEMVQTVRDLIARKEKNKSSHLALESAKREAEFAYCATKIMCNSPCSTHEKYAQIIALLKKHIRAQTFSLMLFHPEEKALVVQAATNDKVVGLKRFLDENAISCWVAREGRPYRRNGRDESAISTAPVPHDQTLSQYRNQSFLSVPVRDEKEMIGVLNVADPDDGRISDSTEDTVSHLMRWVGAMSSSPETSA